MGESCGLGQGQHPSSSPQGETFVRMLDAVYCTKATIAIYYGDGLLMSVLSSASDLSTEFFILNLLTFKTPLCLSSTVMSRNKIIPYRRDLKDKARRLRNESTYSEILLWQEIKNKHLGYQFHRQVPLLDYIVDFYCHEIQLAIEVDGKCHDSLLAKRYDAKRQSRLEECGIKFLRFNDARMKGDINKVVEEIRTWIEGMQQKN